MEKKKVITILFCILFIVFSGVFYLKQGIGSTNSSFTTGTVNMEEDILQVAETGNSSKDGQETEDGNSTLDTAEEIAVYICGAVKHPGVYNLTSGKRICDAVSAAGGFKKSAACSAINLAKVLSDGEQVVVPTKKQAASASKNTAASNKDGNTSNLPQADGLININTASREELMSLPGIGESKADAVIEYRLSNGFKSIEDIKNVTGIKDGVFNQIKDQITV